METVRADGVEEWTAAVSSSFYRLEATRAVVGFSATLRATSLPRGVVIAEVVSERNELVRTARMARQSPSDDVLLLIQLSGQATVRQRDRSVVVEAGTATLCDPLVDYSVTADRPSHQLVLTMPRSVVKNLAAPIASTRARRIDSGIASLRALTVLAEESISGDFDRHLAESDVVAGAVLDLTRVMFARVTGTDEIAPSRVALAETARTFIQDHASDPALTPEEVAHEVGVTLRALVTLLRDDGSPSRLIRTERLRGARERLRDPRHAHRPVWEIARMSGFTDSTTFTRAFVREFGDLPSEFRHA